MQNEQTINAIVKALGYTENGGAPDLKNPSAGKTGEMKSVFQFEPATWKSYSKQVFGQDVPMNADTEAAVVQKKVSDWYIKFQQEGYSPQEIPKMIASSWNAGPGEPHAYAGSFSDGTSSTGINAKYGVKYDVPGYVSKFDKYFNEFNGQTTNQQQSPQNTQDSAEALTPAPTSPANPVPAATQAPAQVKTSLVSAPGSQVNSVKKPITKSTSGGLIPLSPYGKSGQQKQKSQNYKSRSTPKH